MWSIENESVTKRDIKPKKRKKTSIDYAVEFAVKIAVTIAVVVVLCVFVVGIHVNHGNTAYPMLKDGDLVITYKIGDVDDGDAIVYSAGGQVRYGRVVAHSGDEVDISDSYVRVNGYGISEDVIYPTTSEGASVEFPYIVPEGRLFILNDFRKDINDSRTYGAIPESDVEGKVILVLRRRGI